MQIRLGTLSLALVLFAPIAAAETDDGMRIQSLRDDLVTIARVSELAENLGENRQVLTAILDHQIETLREPRGDGTYRWASLEREEGGRKTEEKHLERVHSEETLDQVSVSASNAYRLAVALPQKRGLLSANSRVFVRNAVIDWTAFDGTSHKTDLPIDAWIEPGATHDLALPEIGSNVHATVHLGVESGGKRAVAELSLLEAKLVDDPANPYYSAIRRLVDIRTIAGRKDIRRGELEIAVDEALLTLPGELEKRVAEQQAQIAEREAAVLAGAPRGSIEVGDAAPDVIAALREIGRKLAGTLEEQAAARADLEALTTALAPPLTTSVQP